MMDSNSSNINQTPIILVSSAVDNGQTCQLVLEGLNLIKLNVWSIIVYNGEPVIS